MATRRSSAKSATTARDDGETRTPQPSPASEPDPAAGAAAFAPGAATLAARTPAIRIGTSGFSYAEWRGAFYPPKLPAKDFLRWYAQAFPTTEINNTFYRIPRASVTAGWRTEVPESFRFTLKLSQRITHIKRLKDADTEMSWFAGAALELGATLGPVLVQLPPNFKKDAARLDDFLAKHASRLQLAIEFRHASWIDDEIESLLRARGAAFAVVEAEGGDSDVMPRPRLVTGPFVYMRLRKGDYTPDELRDWAQWMLAQSAPVFCYVKHDDAAPQVARALVAAFAGLDPG